MCVDTPTGILDPISSVPLWTDSSCSRRVGTNESVSEDSLEESVTGIQVSRRTSSNHLYFFLTFLGERKSVNRE